METIIILLIVSNIGCWSCLWEFAKLLDKSTKTVSKTTISAPEILIRESLDELKKD